MPEPRPGVDRRAFLGAGTAVATGLVLGIRFGPRLRAAPLRPGLGLPRDFRPHAFLQVATDGTITFWAKHDEMGQGIHTGLAMTLCEELEAELSRVRVLPAPADEAFGHSAYGIQATGGSTSTWSSYDQIREVGARAREMLITAAAERFGVDRSDCFARSGAVRHRQGAFEPAPYGSLADAAAGVAAPEEVTLKPRSAHRLIGLPERRIDSPPKVRGTARFSLDQRRPGMLVAMIARAPWFGARVRSFDDGPAMAVPGVRAVFGVPAGVAVLAEDTWAAQRGVGALPVEWTDGPGRALDSRRLSRDYHARSALPGVVARDDGDVDAALAEADAVFEAVYEVPFMAHVPMEPLSCMVQLTADGGAEVVTGSQMLGRDHPAVAKRLGVPEEKVRFTNSFLGGGFGRRANPASDFTLDAVEVALAARDRGIAAPIKTVWSREDDIRGGWYRPLFVNRVTAGLGNGRITAWRHRIVGQSIAVGTPFEGAMVRDGLDQTSVEGAADMPHGIPNLRVELHTVSLPVPVQWWRSVGHSNTAFAKESALDECAERLGRDPYQLRRELLAGHPRLLRVLDVAAAEAGWSRRPPRGRGRGISVHESFKGFAAHVVEASIDAEGSPRIHAVTCAIDCGLVINPNQVESQMQGAAIFALSSVLTAGITFADGRVRQSNFHDFPIMRLHEAPEVRVVIVPSTEPMGGIGEVGVPGLASATCSALRAAGGRRIRTLPVGDQLA